MNPENTPTRKTFIKVRVTPDERDAFTKRARELDVSVSDLIRQAAFGTITVRSLDSDAAYELRRIGAMLKHLYPKDANWSNDEKRRYWHAMDTLLGYASQIVPQSKDLS
jgi:hypothetical protein